MGKLADLLNMFELIGGHGLPDRRYVFLGGYVNRGYCSVETIQLLLCLKLQYPHSITLLRSYQESRPVTECYGFYDEALTKYGIATPWQMITDIFDYLPLAALIDG